MQLLVPNAAAQGMIPPFPLSNSIYDDLDAAGAATQGMVPLWNSNNPVRVLLVCPSESIFAYLRAGAAGGPGISQCNATSVAVSIRAP
jgi:hypothetical protein